MCYHKNDGDYMKIIKYKKVNNNKYNIELDNKETIKLDDDTIIFYDLLRKKEIDDLEEINKYDKYMEAYYKSVNYLNRKMRTTKEIRKYLEDYPSKTIEMVIERLNKEGYLNDKYYLKVYISNQISITNYGPNKIMRKLLELGYNKEEIIEELYKYDKEIFLEKLDKLVDKKIKSNTKYSSNKLKEKIVIDLFNNGYDKKDVFNILDNKSITTPLNILDKEFNKAYKSLSKKYDGYDLENKLLAKLMSKGFNYDDIKKQFLKYFNN